MSWKSATGSEVRTRLVAACVAGTILWAPFQVQADIAQAWRLDKHENGIQVFSRLVEGSEVRAVKAEVDINAPFGLTVALLLDAAMRPHWDEICAEASVYERVSDVEDVIYVHNDLPWPVNDRDMVLRRSWSIAVDGSRAQIRAAVEDGVLPEVAGRVRVKQADSVWTVVRTGASSVRLSTEIHAEPGGPIPGWLMNSLSVQGPYNALRNIRQLLESGSYPQAGAVSDTSTNSRDTIPG